MGNIQETVDFSQTAFSQVENFINGAVSTVQDLAFNLVQNTVGTLKSFAQQIYDDVLSGVISTIQEVIGTISSYVQGIAQQVRDQIASELAKFAEWAQKQLDFSTGSFLAQIPDNECPKEILDFVASPDLLNNLNLDVDLSNVTTNLDIDFTT